MRGRFITFEGGEGTGKSTQAAIVALRLKALGVDVLSTREPGGSPGAEIIRHVILSGAAKPLGAEMETVLFASARDDHVRNTIRPALERGAWVLSDRFSDSTRAYQGVVGEVDQRLIEGLERITVGDTKPDLTFILDVTPEVGLARAAKRRGKSGADRYESETLEFHERLRDAFRAIAQRESDRCVLIDATPETATIAAEIWEIVEQRLNPAASKTRETKS